MIVEPGRVVSAVASALLRRKAEQYGVRALFFLVQVTTERSRKITERIDAGELKTEVGEVLWLDEARQGYEMLEGAPHPRRKILIKIAD